MARTKSIRREILIPFSLIILALVLGLVIVFYRFSSDSLFRTSVRYTQTITGQLNQSIDSYIDTMNNICSIIAGNVDAHRFLSGEADEEAMERIRDQFGVILRSRSDIRNIGILSSDGRAFFNNGEQQLNPYMDLTALDWYRQAQENRSHRTLTSSHVQHVIYGEHPWVITVCEDIEPENGKAGTGLVFIDLNYDAISGLCDSNELGSGNYIFILDKNGGIVYHPKQQQIYNDLVTENIEEVMGTTEDSLQAGESGQRKLYTISRSELTGWSVVSCTDVQDLLSANRRAFYVYGAIALMVVVVTILISGQIANTITRPIMKLRDTMARVQDGAFPDKDLEITTDNEVGSLTKSFNTMTRRIRNLMDQNIHEQEEKRRIEMKALQSQINPHFLYNTLDSIIWMAESGKNQEVVLMTSSLAKLLRQSISNEEEIVTVKSEFEYARSYLTIQKMRYQDKLEYSLELDPEAARATIIKLALQPIIENAIYHGLKYKEDRGLLTVTGVRDGDDVVIEIRDDGVGMDEETRRHIFDEHKVNYRSNGIGVYNVQRRLKLFYGNSYGITYRSEKGVGTTARIRIPFETGGETPYDQ